MSATRFLRQFIRQPTSVGAITPSGPALVRMMVDSFDWPNIRHVAEYGPGTGVFTEAIVRTLPGDATFFAIEQSPDLAAITRERCPEVTVHCDRVVNVEALCQTHDIGSLDAIICGLPWAAFSDALQSDIMSAMLRVLRPGGTFATFAYLQGVPLPAGRRFARRLDQSFRKVSKSPVVWRNLPPAFVYRCVH